MSEPTPAELRQMVLEVVDSDQYPWAPSDIANTLMNQGVPVNDRRVARNVSELVKRGELAWVWERRDDDLDHQVGLVRA